MVLEKLRIKRKIINSALPITFFITFITWFVINIGYYNVSTNISENIRGNPPGEYKHCEHWSYHLNDKVRTQEGVNKKIWNFPCMECVARLYFSLFFIANLRILLISPFSYTPAFLMQRYNRNSLLQDEIQAQPWRISLLDDQHVDTEGLYVDIHTTRISGVRLSWGRHLSQSFTFYF